jgi:hypothetical protein
MQHRYYLWTEDGPRRLTHDFFNDRTPLPQYAGTTQKAVDVSYEWRGDELYTTKRGHYLTFDVGGRLDGEAPMRRGVKNRWDLSKADEDRVVQDLLPVGDKRRRPIPIARG